MRILFFFHMSGVRGGASKSGLTLVRGLHEFGHEIYAVCPGEGSLADELRKSGVSVHSVRFEWALPCFRKDAVGVLKFVPALIRNSIINRRAYSELAQYAQEISPDLVHSNSSVIDMGLRVANKLGVPHVTHFREMGFSDAGAIMAHKRRMMAYPRQFSIAIGRQVFQKHSLGGSDRNRIIYNGVADASRCRINPSEGDYLFYAGVLSASKGIEDLLSAYSLLTEDIRKRYRLKIAGSTPIIAYKEKLDRICRRLGIDDDVEWLGERRDVSDLMYGAKAIVVPSINEGFGRIVVEAMGNGTVVIGRNTAGIKEQFDNGLELTGQEIGLRFSDVKEMAECMEHICRSDHEENIEMVRRSQTVVSQLYSVDRYIHDVDSFYRMAINS